YLVSCQVSAPAVPEARSLHVGAAAAISSSVKKVRAVMMRIVWYWPRASRSLSPVTMMPAFTATAVAMDVIVVGIAAAGADIRQRIGKQAGDPLQIRAPGKDCFLAVAVA